jgi:thiol-disulfide isomerase/thioredoxin
MRMALLQACLVLCASPALAHETCHGTQGLPLGNAWDFTLPTLDGTRFVQAAAVKGPLLVNFWGRDCGPCITELPRLQAFAKAHPQWTVLLVSTDATTDAREFVQRHGVELNVLRPGANVAALMRSAGNRNGGLPFTVALRDSRVCDGQLGELSASDLLRMIATCGKGDKP